MKDEEAACDAEDCVAIFRGKEAWRALAIHKKKMHSDLYGKAVSELRKTNTRNAIYLKILQNPGIRGYEIENELFPKRPNNQHPATPLIALLKEKKLVTKAKKRGYEADCKVLIRNYIERWGCYNSEFWNTLFVDMVSQKPFCNTFSEKFAQYMGVPTDKITPFEYSYAVLQGLLYITKALRLSFFSFLDQDYPDPKDVDPAIIQLYSKFFKTGDMKRIKEGISELRDINTIGGAKLKTIKDLKIFFTHELSLEGQTEREMLRPLLMFSLLPLPYEPINDGVALPEARKRQVTKLKETFKEILKPYRTEKSRYQVLVNHVESVLGDQEMRKKLESLDRLVTLKAKMYNAADDGRYKDAYRFLKSFEEEFKGMW